LEEQDSNGDRNTITVLRGTNIPQWMEENRNWIRIVSNVRCRFYHSWGVRFYYYSLRQLIKEIVLFPYRAGVVTSSYDINEKCLSQSNQNCILVITWLGDLISVKTGDEVVGGEGGGTWDRWGAGENY
jgi:hypothetical protein